MKPNNSTNKSYSYQIPSSNSSKAIGDVATNVLQDGLVRKSKRTDGFVDLIKDLNGNHVIQHCLQCLSKEDNK
ncbi:hypothetical protein LOK49_LG10G00489, partial [Camellia lanceoleosa]